MRFLFNTLRRRVCMTKQWKTAALAAAAALAACGGGGGGGSSGGTSVTVPSGQRTEAASAGSDARADNLVELGAWLARAVLSAGGEGALDVTGTREQPMAAGPARAIRAAGAAQVRVAKAALQLAAPGSTARERPQATETQTVTCINGGTVTITVDAARTDDVSPGDTISVTTNNCQLDSTLPIANGGFSMEINALELSGDTLTALDVDVTFNSFALVGYGSYSGSGRLWTKNEGAGERIRVSYSDTTVTYGASTLTFDFDLYGLSSATSATFDLNGGLGISGQRYAMVGGDVMSAAAGKPPGAGSLNLRDAAGDTIRLTARSATTFDLDFYPAGATSPTASLPGELWDDFVGAP
jgi:hypothetical protein